MAINGLVVIDKPPNCTSHDVVNRWRRLAGIRRVGHLGTLDPMATGVLALLTGNATRLAQFYGGNDKTYLAEITLGMTSDSYDADGEITLTGAAAPSEIDIRTGMERFRGCFEQVPPPVSAKKIKGTPAYKLARRQQTVELPPVLVEVKELEVHSATVDRICATIRCTAGTYIRGIAHDLGQMLGCGAILQHLRRVQSGEFTIDEAKTLDELRRTRGRRQAGPSNPAGGATSAAFAFSPCRRNGGGADTSRPRLPDIAVCYCLRCSAG